MYQTRDGIPGFFLCKKKRKILCIIFFEQKFSFILYVDESIWIVQKFVGFVVKNFMTK